MPPFRRATHQNGKNNDKIYNGKQKLAPTLWTCSIIWWLMAFTSTFFHHCCWFDSWNLGGENFESVEKYFGLLDQIHNQIGHLIDFFGRFECKSTIIWLQCKRHDIIIEWTDILIFGKFWARTKDIRHKWAMSSYVLMVKMVKIW